LELTRANSRPITLGLKFQRHNHKGQKKSNKEVRKPKAEKVKPKLGAPVAKKGDLKGMEHLKR
jgi:hypothetical protein